MITHSKRVSLPKTYKHAKIPEHEENKNVVYYYHLLVIAIDLLKRMASETELGRGWDKVPTNKSDSKTKIIKSLISMRKQKEGSGRYELDQLFYLGTLIETLG